MKTIDQFISERFDPAEPHGTKLSEITAGAVHLGFRSHNLHEKLFPLCSDEDVQKKWSNWADISEREEIRLRLLALNTFDTIHESLIPFLIFFFRSSDSLLYQTAAQIIGKHLPHHTELKKFFGDYLQKRKLDPSTPFDLSGLRSRRRIIVALTACYIHNGPKYELVNPASGETFEIGLPLDFELLVNKPPKNHLDLSATMLALSIILKAKPSPEAKKAAGSLLDIPGKQDVKIWERNVIRNWGILLNAAPHSEEEKLEFCSNFIATGLNHIAESKMFTDRLQALFEMDEIIKSSVFLPHTVSSIQNIDIDEHDPRQTGLKVFCEQRFNHWTLRVTDREALCKIEQAAELPTMKIMAGSRISANGEYRHDTVAELLQALTDERQWRLQSMPERAARSFFLLDFAANNHHMQDEELQQMISAVQPDIQENGYHSGSISDGDERKPVLNVLLQRLLDLEQSAKGHIPDGRLIQKIDDENLLVSLLPTGIDSELLPILADAFEHRLRLLLATDSAFSLDHYLYKITVREPHQNFFRFMRELTIDRPYGRPGETAVDLSSRFSLLYLQATGKLNSDMSIGAADLPFWNSIMNLRDRITAEMTGGDLFGLLEKFCRELEGTGVETVGRTATLHDLINITQQGAAYWLRSGFPAVSKLSSSFVNQRLTALQRQLRSDILKLKPNTLSDTTEAGEASQRIKEGVHEAGILLCPSLGKSEAQVFRQFIELLENSLNRWISALNKAGQQWTRNQKEKSLSGESGLWNDLFYLICEEKYGSLKMELLAIMLCSMFRSDTGSVQRSWFKRYQVLTWAVKVKTSGYLSNEELSQWRQFLLEYWTEMLLSAKEENQEARVAQLVKANELEDLRRQESVQPLLESVKTWCFERYDLNHAYICNRELNTNRNQIQNRWKTAKEFFSHFSYVWLALIVGVIMMFDFGDPWTELAEIGDIGGVIFTFVLGVGGTYLYVFADLRKKVKLVKGDPFVWVSQFGRVAVFLVITMVFTIAMVLLFYYMFSSTEQVVEGPNAIWHIMSWTGFALFIGVFFGLIGKNV